MGENDENQVTPEQYQQLQQQHADLQRQLEARERDAWKADAVKQYAHAAEFSDMISGSTKEEVLATAKAIHEKLEGAVAKAVEEAMPAAARKAYGSPAAGGGGTPPQNRNPLDALTEEVGAFLHQGGPRPTYEKMNQYVREWGARALAARIGQARGGA